MKSKIRDYAFAWLFLNITFLFLFLSCSDQKITETSTKLNNQKLVPVVKGRPLQVVATTGMIADVAAKIGGDKISQQMREVRLKVFLPREGTPSVPSLYKLFRGADRQERETFDMFGIVLEGHPHPKRLLMPEDWKGWPLRKDYVQPDFYEMQDAY